jgi:hypothetical protein
VICLSSMSKSRVVAPSCGVDKSGVLLMVRVVYCIGTVIRYKSVMNGVTCT